jgi:hypothetical protein
LSFYFRTTVPVSIHSVTITQSYDDLNSFLLVPYSPPVTFKDSSRDNENRFFAACRFPKSGHL